MAASHPDFDQLSLERLRRRQSEKWRHFPADVLPSFVAEMDFPLAAAIAEALVSAIHEADTGYAFAAPELAEALARFAADRFDWRFEPSDVRVIPDVMSGVTEFLRVAARPGDGVVINTPVYPPFFSHILEAGCQVVEAPLAAGAQGYQLDLARLERAFAAGARFYLLCNPHNPTGLVYSRDELADVAALAERYDIIVLADEIHAPLVMPGAQHVPFLSLGEGAAGRAIALVSASKGWNIPGLKCAQVVAASERMRKLADCLPEEMVARGGNLGVIASTVAYRDAVDWLDQLIAVLDRNRRLLAGLLAERLPAIRYRPPQGTYLAWLDCRGLGLPEEPADFFLERGRVALGPGPKFGLLGAGFVRITMATSEPILREIVDRMAASINLR